MSESPHWRRDITLSLLALILVTLAAVWTRVWVITAVPIGFLFGFLLQKGDLCGASAFSEVVLVRDWRKVFGLWVAIVVSMAGFAIIAELGWVQLTPKPMLWLNVVVGGVLFGAGMVLAGGCVSGCLFKAGAGNLNSMAALVGIPLGIAMVEYGPLNPVHRSMMTHVVKSASGGPVSLSSLTGLPYWVLALGFAGATLAWVLASRTKRRGPAGSPRGRTASGILTGPWKPWQAGLAIGLLAVPAYLSSAATGRNYPLGVTHGVLHAYEALTNKDVVYVWRPAAPAAPAPPRKPINLWLVGLVASMVPGAWFAARLSGTARLARREPAETVTAFFGGVLVGAGAAFGRPAAPAAPAAATAAGAAQPLSGPAPAPAPPRKPINLWLVGLVASMVPGAWFAARLSGTARLARREPAETVTAFFGGVLVGAGAAFATGCVIGNILSGWALMSVGAFLFGIFTILANWVTTYLYLMGGTFDGATASAVLADRK